MLSKWYDSRQGMTFKAKRLSNEMLHKNGELFVDLKFVLYMFLKKWMPVLDLPNLHIFRTRFDATYFLSFEWVVVSSVVKFDVLSLS